MAQFCDTVFYFSTLFSVLKTIPFIFILLLLLHNIEYHAQIGMTRQEKKKGQ